MILVSGDTYTDNSYNGTAVIGHWLMENGFRVGIIAQPRTDVPDDITRLGMPELFWSVSSGCVDSMVANYTATNKFRKDDDFTPGGVNDRRPDRACIAYTNLIKKYAKGKPIILGGIEASLRRLAHYDYWSDSIRRSVLFDSKADAITYGMAELSNLRLAQCMRDGVDWKDTPGLCYASSQFPEGYLLLPSYEECRSDRSKYLDAFRTFYRNCDPITAKGLAQDNGGRFLIQNPPQRLLTSEELDGVYEMDFENAVHPYYLKDGKVKAMETVRNSITTHRGCYGECSFCAIAMHQGSTVVSRSEDSIIREVERMASDPHFNGIIQDVGGPTANMYGIECARKLKHGACQDKSCLGDSPCPSLHIDHGRQIALLKRIRAVPGVRKVFVNSGIRYDMILADRNGDDYLETLIRYHVSGQMKIAPEHVSRRVLRAMGKPGPDKLLEFKSDFDSCAERCGKDLFLTYYFIAAHPGCHDEDMQELSRFCHSKLRMNPEQVQIFTPTPSTVSTCMYCTGMDMDGKRIFSEHSVQRKRKQKEYVVRSGDARNRCLQSRVLEGRVPVRGVQCHPEAQDAHELLLPHRPRSHHHRADRLSPGRSRPGPQGPVLRDSRVVQREEVRSAGVFHEICDDRRLRRQEPSQVHPEVQEHNVHSAGQVQGSDGFDREAAGFRSGAAFGHRELVHLMGIQYGQVQVRAVQPDVPCDIDQPDIGFRGCARSRGGFRRVS